MTQTPPKRKRGAPLGNQNARKHGFYSTVLSPADRRHLKQAALVGGIDEEINLLRVKLRSVVQNDPDNVKLILQAANSVCRLLRTRERIATQNPEMLQKAIENVVRDIAIPLGSGALSLFKQKEELDHPDLSSELPVEHKS